MAWTNEKIEATLQSVRKRAQEDAAFREKLKNNPKEALEAEADEAIPDALRIAIVDQNDIDLVITLPKTLSNELSDVDLEHVAGGKPANERALVVCIADGKTSVGRPGYWGDDPNNFLYEESWCFKYC